MKVYNNSIVVKFDTEVSGNAGAGKFVTVYDTGTTNKAPLFDINIVPITNPVQADDDGNYTFNINDGVYDLVIDEGLPSEFKIKNEQIANNSPTAIFDEEILTLADSQTTVVFNTAKSEFFIGTTGVDRGKLFEGLDNDYTVTNEKTIELTRTYDAGTKIAGTTSATTVITDRDVKKVDVIANAIADIGLLDGDALNVKEVVIGDADSAMWDVVQASSVVINGDSIRQCIGAPTLAVVRRTYPSKEFQSVMFRRELKLNLGFINPTYTEILNDNSYNFIYPQAMAVDTIANEVWLLRSPNGGAPTETAWIFVHDLTTGVVKTAWTTGLQWRESAVIHYDGIDRFFYTIDADTGNVNKYNVTALPANKSTVAPTTSFAVNAYSQMAHDGINFYVQDFDTSFGKNTRNKFKVFDAGFNQTGFLVLPMDGVGTLNDYISNFPKIQGVTFHNGSLYFGCGTAFDPDNLPGTPPTDVSRYMGIQAFTPTGEKLGTALCSPDLFLPIMDELAGYSTFIAENEGVSSSGGNLYALWITSGDSDPGADDDVGIVISKELSSSALTVDFAPAQIGVKTALNAQDFMNITHHSANVLKNPVTQADLTTFNEIFEMMIQLDLAIYTFAGENQVIDDIDSNPAPVNNNLVFFTLVDGNSGLVEIRGPNTFKQYWVDTGFTNQTIKDITLTP